MLNTNFVILGAVINILGSASYLRDTLRGKAKPNRVSFFMWTLAPMLAFAAEIQKGVGTIAVMTFAAGFAPLMILVASFADKKSYWKLTSFDLICGVLSLLGLTLWAFTREGNVAIFFGIVADFLAAIPTIRKSYHYPETENWVGYFTGAISGAIALLTIDHWTLASYGFPLYIVLVCIVLTSLIKFPKLRFKTTASGVY